MKLKKQEFGYNFNQINGPFRYRLWDEVLRQIQSQVWVQSKRQFEKNLRWDTFRFEGEQKK